MVKRILETTAILFFATMVKAPMDPNGNSRKGFVVYNADMEVIDFLSGSTSSFDLRNKYSLNASMAPSFNVTVADFKDYSKKAKN